jgi:hypothetical protein
LRIGFIYLDRKKGCKYAGINNYFHFILILKRLPAAL